MVHLAQHLVDILPVAVAVGIHKIQVNRQRVT
jgi:hypothetical protein